MDTELKLFLDEIIHQLVKLNKNVDYITNELSAYRARQDNTLRKANDGFDKIS